MIWLERLALSLKNDNCCGCLACEAVCRQTAIHVIQDGGGFIYPQIDKEKCVVCGMCIKVCPLKAIERINE